MDITLNALHWIYLIGMVVILVTMVMRKNVVVPCILFTLLTGLIASGSLVGAVLVQANALLFALGEFGSLILGIGVMVAMAKQMADMGTDRFLIEPLSKFIKHPGVSYFILGGVMAIITALVWPSPGVALVGGLLTPIAVRAGMPAIWAAVAMNMFGHGLVFSLDPVIQGAGGITAGTAGITVAELISTGWPVWLSCGVVALTCSFVAFQIDMKRRGNVCVAQDQVNVEIEGDQQEQAIHPAAKFMAIFTPICFALAIGGILIEGLAGGDALNMLIGTGVIVTVVGAILQYGVVEALERFVGYAQAGMEFGIMAFTSALFIGGFFFIGGSGVANILPGEYAQGLLMDWAWWLSDMVPMSEIPVVILMAIIGGLTGLGGSGFSGLPLVGSLALAFGSALDMNIAVLAMIGQLGAVWIGGGTVVPWAVIPVAAICDVDAVELCRKNLVPTFAGLATACVVAVMLL